MYLLLLPSNRFSELGFAETMSQGQSILLYITKYFLPLKIFSFEKKKQKAVSEISICQPLQARHPAPCVSAQLDEAVSVLEAR